MTDTGSDDPGHGRDEDMERARPTDRPADASLEADPESAAEKPLTVSPDPDDEGR